MILALIIWILNIIAASDERLIEALPHIKNLDQIKLLQDAGIYSYFDTLGKGAKSGFYLAAGIELAIEFMMLLHFLPQYLAAKFERIRNKSIHDAQILKAIKYKIENDLILTKKEQKWWTKQQKKGGKYEKK
ncbi:hypothetical protein BCF59_0502 [Mycoplasmopsis mustelae]|uniref:Uncharacterized protein n=1 Tax=Mycoplasmopsis mustelae TaxID=171289 RepID=A0A4R7UEF0_9BACT|nr:hypothetical protein [Mycoplasmopsis mustelae]TDV23513.1 hypothetical protein BCF59_0502 [Mycoplasmopsis mustelae]